jgi:hypothetical protein
MKTKPFIFLLFAIAFLLVSCNNRKQEQASEIADTVFVDMERIREWVAMDRAAQRNETENNAHSQQSAQDTIFVTHTQPIRGYHVSTKWVVDAIADVAMTTTRFTDANNNIVFQRSDTLGYFEFRSMRILDLDNLVNGQTVYVSDTEPYSGNGGTLWFGTENPYIHHISSFLIHRAHWGFIDLDGNEKYDIVFFMSSTAQRERPSLVFYSFPNGRRLNPDSRIDIGSMIDFRNRRIIQDHTGGALHTEFWVYSTTFDLLKKAIADGWALRETNSLQITHQFFRNGNVVREVEGVMTRADFEELDMLGFIYEGL